MTRGNPVRPNQPYLFLDDEWMADAAGLDFRIHPPRCEGIVLAPEREWEAYRILPISVIDDGVVCRMWYQAVAGYPGAAGPLSCPRCRAQNPGIKVVCIACGWPLVDVDYLQNELIGMCYAESTDGIRWNRPELGLVEFRGSRRNNLIAGPCGVPALNPRGGVGERFVGIVEHQRQLYVAVSPDGLRWSRRPEPCLPFCADSTNQIIYDPERDQYVALLRGFPGRRTTVRCVLDSLDRAPWPFEEHGHERDATGTRYVTDELETALDIDDDDPTLSGLDINHISANCYGPGAWLAFPALYRKYPPAGLDRAGRDGHRFFAQGNDGTWETQLAVSRDGRRWSRPDRTAYLAPGFSRGPDGGINSIAVGMVHRGALIHQYGFGQYQTHGIFSPGEGKGTGAIFRHVQERDRFISATAGPRGGRFLTHPFEMPGGELRLNIDCGGLGEASVEIRDGEGRPLDGFSHGDCDRVDLNQLDHAVSWRGRRSLDGIAGRTARIDFRLCCARLYACTLGART